MTEFAASYQHLESAELVRYLLNASGQLSLNRVNPKDLLDYLELEYLCFSFRTELPQEAKESFRGETPRAMISFRDRLVASDDTLGETRTRFSVLHEIGHYILPSHQNSLYVCDARSMSYWTHLTFEKEANQVAADLLFLGERFDIEANSREISAATMKTLAEQFGASFEATARRMVERSYKPCMLVCFQNSAPAGVDNAALPNWQIRYCVPSPAFENRFFEKLRNGIVPTSVWDLISAPGRNVDESETVNLTIECGRPPAPKPFSSEYFFNRHNVFCFLIPEPH